MKHKLLIGLLLLFILVLTTGCQPKKVETIVPETIKTDVVEGETELENKSIDEAYYPVTVRNYTYDQAYSDITLKAHPQRVVVTNTTTLEIMLELGLGEFIVLCDETKSILPKYQEAYEKLKHVEDTYNRENILMAQPDFIIGWSSVFNPDKIGPTSYWRERDVNTFIQRNTGGEVTRNVDNIYWDILDIGKLFNCEERAEKLVMDLKAEQHELAFAISKYNKKHFDTYESKTGVAVIEIADEGEYRFYGQKALAHDMLIKLGIKDVTEGYGYGYSDEHLIEINPDALVVVYFSSQSAEEVTQKIYDNKVLSNISAVKNGQVYGIPLGQMYGGGMSTPEGFRTFAKAAYPDLFE